MSTSPRVATAEAASLRELGERALPLLRRVVGAASALLYRYDETGDIRGKARPDEHERPWGAQLVPLLAR